MLADGSVTQLYLHCPGSRAIARTEKAVAAMMITSSFFNISSHITTPTVR